MLAVCSTLAVSCWVTSAAAAPATALQAVSYAGYRFEVPASWPVINLASQPQTCVRFDLHAVYLGTPAVNESCPGWLLGTTEAILIQSAPRSAPLESVESAVTDRITASAPGVSITATFDTDPAEITSILASAGLAAPKLTTAVTAGRDESAHELTVAAAPVRNAAAAATRSQDLPATVGNYVGLGFDTCTAPSSSVMQTWLQDSPYRAIGIYIGGADTACDQPNLTAAWVQQQATAGWRFIPMYAGPQAAFGQLTAPAQQGVADANDAVAQAQSLGFGPGTPLYYDMEAYPSSESAAALEFLAAWTGQVHQLGYAAGVYASSDSGVADLAQDYNGGATTPDVIFDALWNGEPDTSDSNIPAGDWTGGRRVHQFSGNASQSFGGDSMVIDQDYLDVSLPAQPVPVASVTPLPSPSATATPASTPSVTPSATPQPSASDTPAPSASDTPAPSASDTPAPSASDTPAPSASATPAPSATSTPIPAVADTGGTSQASPAVVTQGGTTELFYTDSGHLIEQSASAGGLWTRTELTGDASGVPSTVQVGSGTTDVFYRGTDGFLWELTSSGSGWLPPQRLAQMGRVGTPEAVSQPDGVIDVFWQGAIGYHLWHAQYNPTTGWTGPQNLGGVLDGQPYPVEALGGVQVFWRGLGSRNLWRVAAATSGTWSSPQDLGMGELGSSPQAVALANGEVDVFWRGLGQQRDWFTLLVPGAAATPARPIMPISASGIGQAWPVLGAGGEWLLFEGRYGGLRTITRAADGKWLGSRWAGISKLAAFPFAAAGPESGPLEVFWLSKTGQLWTASYTQSSGWSEPVELGQ